MLILNRFSVANFETGRSNFVRIGPGTFDSDPSWSKLLGWLRQFRLPWSVPMLGCFRSQLRVNDIVVNRTFVLATFSRLNMHIHRSIPFSIPFYLFHSTKDNTPCFFARVAKMVLIREAVGGLIKFFQQANDCATQRTFLLCLFNTTRRCLRSLSPLSSALRIFPWQFASTRCLGTVRTIESTMINVVSCSLLHCDSPPTRNYASFIRL